MKITKTSPLTGQVNELDIAVTSEQLADYASGTLAQDAFPHLSADDREFLMTGITPSEWDNAFGEDF